MDYDKICRFCLSTKNGLVNPLITPCQCKGSLEFVHLKCLNRWRHQDLQRNWRRCCLCLTVYKLLDLQDFEHIPKLNATTYYILYYPGSVFLLFDYICIVLLSSQPTLEFEFLYLLGKYGITFLYIFTFAKHLEVKNKKLYLQSLSKVKVAFLGLIHMWLLQTFHHQKFVVGPLLSIYPSFYWFLHLNTLERVNQRLLIL